MLTYQLTDTGYRIFFNDELRLEQFGDPRLPCIEPRVLTPFANEAEAIAHATQAIAEMTPTETPSEQ